MPAGIIPATMEDIMAAYSQARGELLPVDGEVMPLQESHGQSQVTSKELPAVRAYHLKYNARGEVVDWHYDYFHTDANGLMRKLSRRYGSGDAGAGQPVWVLRLPSGAMQVNNTLVACEHPSCPWTGSTPEERRVHMRAAHREWYAMESEREAREQRESELKLLREQNAINQRLVAELTQERAERERGRKGAKGDGS